MGALVAGVLGGAYTCAQSFQRSDIPSGAMEQQWLRGDSPMDVVAEAQWSPRTRIEASARKRLSGYVKQSAAGAGAPHARARICVQSVSSDRGMNAEIIIDPDTVGASCYLRIQINPKLQTALFHEIRDGWSALYPQRVRQAGNQWVGIVVEKWVTLHELEHCMLYWTIENWMDPYGSKAQHRSGMPPAGLGEAGDMVQTLMEDWIIEGFGGVFSEILSDTWAALSLIDEYPRDVLEELLDVMARCRNNRTAQQGVFEDPHPSGHALLVIRNSLDEPNHLAPGDRSKAAVTIAVASMAALLRHNPELTGERQGKNAAAILANVDSDRLLRDLLRGLHRRAQEQRQAVQPEIRSARL